MGAAGPDQSRIVSLDQFRGYTVLGMFLVNFLGSYHVIDSAFPVLKHYHTYCSYADTIMPQFFFAVGFAYRLTLLRRLEKGGAWSACTQAVRRNLGLILLGVVVHHLDGRYERWAEMEALGVRGFLSTAFQRSLFQTLVHIGVTALWILPVIAARPAVRVAFAVLSGLLHVALSYGLFFDAAYYTWVMNRPGIDGGPLGFLTWAIPMLAGSLAYDAWTASAARPPVARFLVWGAALMLLGYGLSCLNRVTPTTPPADGRLAVHSLSVLNHVTPPDRPADGIASYLAGPPFVNPRTPPGKVTGPARLVAQGAAAQAPVGAPLGPLVQHLVALRVMEWEAYALDGKPNPPVNYWTMSQRAGSITYLVFGTGFSLAVFALFVLACDRHGWQMGVFRTLGVNALAGYVIHDLVGDAVKPFVPRDAPLWYVLAGFAVFFALCYVFLRYLEKHKLFLRL